MSEISSVSIRIAVNGWPTHDLEVDVDKSQEWALLRAITDALENAWNPFVSDLPMGES